MSSSSVRIVALAAGMLVLAACSPPAAPVGPVTVNATLHAEPGSEVAVAGFYLMYDMSLSVTAQASGVIAPEPGTYLGPASPIDSSGTMHLILPNPADLPDAVLGTAEHFLWLPAGPPVLCPTTASVPSARVSSAISLTGPAVPMVAILTGEGLYISYVADKEVDFSAGDEQYLHMRPLTWLYADNDVDVKTAAGGCANGTDPTVFVDLGLKKGWNQVAWTLEEDPLAPGTAKSMTLGNAPDVDPIYVSFTAVVGP
ncbi:MAG: hypothetical protein ROY82_11010 [Truepera sp.]|jgi:hypothetical protein|nr:hypothetical protein [Truepera sp.]